MTLFYKKANNPKAISGLTSNYHNTVLQLNCKIIATENNKPPLSYNHNFNLKKLKIFFKYNSHEQLFTKLYFSFSY
jgi:hypothetical protein